MQGGEGNGGRREVFTGALVVFWRRMILESGSPIETERREREGSDGLREEVTLGERHDGDRCSCEHEL